MLAPDWKNVRQRTLQGVRWDRQEHASSSSVTASRLASFRRGPQGRRFLARFYNVVAGKEPSSVSKRNVRSRGCLILRPKFFPISI